MVILSRMKTAISIPDELFLAADRAARQLGISRSEFYQRAVSSYLERRREGLVTDALNAVYETEGSSGVDPALARMQRSSLPKEDW